MRELNDATRVMGAWKTCVLHLIYILLTPRPTQHSLHLFGCKFIENVIYWPIYAYHACTDIRHYTEVLARSLQSRCGIKQLLLHSPPLTFHCSGSSHTLCLKYTCTLLAQIAKKFHIYWNCSTALSSSTASSLIFALKWLLLSASSIFLPPLIPLIMLSSSVDCPPGLFSRLCSEVG